MTNINRLEVLLFGKLPYKWKRVLFKIWFTLSEAGRVSGRGERWVAGSWKEVLAVGEFYGVHHAHRYHWANSILFAPSTVLDLGCGTGYGSWFLASQGKKVTGYDVDEKSINWAKKHFQHENLTFTTILDEKIYDHIVCFETLEHAPEAVEKYISKCLSSKGTLIISTANGSTDSVRNLLIKMNLVTINPGHVKEFTKNEFELLLKKYFGYVAVFGQCAKNVYSFMDWNNSRKKNNIKIEDFEMRSNDFSNCEVLVAVCKK